LNQPYLIDKSPEDLEIQRDNIQQLIGYFNLDPNRVLDLILEAFESNIANAMITNDKSLALQICDNLKRFVQVESVFMQMINSSTLFINQSSQFQQLNKSKTIAAILGFKLSSILLTLKPSGQNPKEIVPIPLLYLISLLIKNTLITPEQIWPYTIK
jgi:THO complex subunit 2